jgi:hypothetical protein
MVSASEEELKKKLRAERFGNANVSAEDEEEKRKRRAERFGYNHTNLDTGRVITNSLANKRLKQ